MMSQTLFISDLHLQDSEPRITATFLDFIQHRAPHADALFILGDFFETWIGDDDHTPFNDTIIHALRQLADTGVPLYFMRGNHDFLIGKKFITQCGMTLLEDPTVFKVYDKPILFTHGDILCTLDVKHQNYRKKVHQPWLQKLFLTLPLSWRQRIAERLRQHSKKRYTHTAPHIMDVTPEEVTRTMQTHDVELLIHGHTHRPAIHDIDLNGKPAHRIVLGSWHKEGSVLVYNSDGSYQLESFPLV